METDDLLRNPEVEVDFGNLSDDDQIGIFNTLEKSVFLFHNNANLITLPTLFGFF